MMLKLFIGFLVLIKIVVCSENDHRVVQVESGKVGGEKYWNGDFYEFYNIPYATAPKGKDRFKAPLPPTKWDGVLAAKDSKVICPQTFYTGEDAEEIFTAGEEDCLLMNLLVPAVADEDNLVPVIVYVHSGAFAAGNGNMAKYHYLARHDIIVASFNFRLGAYGFACLGTEEIPGNAGMKDAVAALRWINRNIRKFGGDPKKVTLAGFSVGATMAELLTLSKATEGLIDKLVLESGSALSPYAINRHPVETALNIARSIGYEGTGDLKELAEFYVNASTEKVAWKSLNFFLTNSTFGFAPCIENELENVEPFLTESPLDIMERGDHPKVAVLTGYANKEGISRALKFEEWSVKMNEDLTPFLPADLRFPNEKERDEFVKKIKKTYFNNEKISEKNLEGYVDYFSDSMFKFPIMKSTNLHARNSGRPTYLYEFSFMGTLNLQHQYMDRIQGASHRDQSSYVLDFLTFTNNIDDLNMRDRMTSMWAEFVKFGNPTVYESPVVDYKWRAYTERKPDYLSINTKTEMKEGKTSNAYKFWEDIYNKYYWTPTKPEPPKIVVAKKAEAKSTEKVTLSKEKKLEERKDNEDEKVHKNVKVLHTEQTKPKAEK